MERTQRLGDHVNYIDVKMKTNTMMYRCDMQDMQIVGVREEEQGERAKCERTRFTMLNKE